MNLTLSIRKSTVNSPMNKPINLIIYNSLTGTVCWLVLPPIFPAHTDMEINSSCGMLSIVSAIWPSADLNGPNCCVCTLYSIHN